MKKTRTKIFCTNFNNKLDTKLINVKLTGVNVHSQVKILNCTNNWNLYKCYIPSKEWKSLV